MPFLTINKMEFTAVDFKEKKDMFLIRMAFVLIFTALAIICAIIWMPMPASGEDAAKYMVGFLFGTLLTTLITNIYGTSQSSKEKDKTIEKQIQTASDAAQVAGVTSTIVKDELIKQQVDVAKEK